MCLFEGGGLSEATVAFDCCLDVGAENLPWWSEMILIRFPMRTATVVRKKQSDDRTMMTPISHDIGFPS